MPDQGFKVTREIDRDKLILRLVERVARLEADVHALKEERSRRVPDRSLFERIFGSPL